MTYYYIKRTDGKIINYSTNINDMELTLPFMRNCFEEIFESEEEIVANPKTGELDFRSNLEDVLEEQREKEIAMLNMTRLDFIKALESIGVSWNIIKGLIEKYPNVEKELMLCSNVYRGNPLIDQMAALVDPSITHEVLDQLFIRHQFEQEFNNVESGDLQ